MEKRTEHRWRTRSPTPPSIAATVVQHQFDLKHYSWFDSLKLRTKNPNLFSFQGNGYWLLVYAMNVGGGGDISSMLVKGSRTGWISMSHNWGASYQAFATLGGQALSFRLTSYTNKETIYAWNVAPSNWNVGQTYTANVNVH